MENSRSGSVKALYVMPEELRSSLAAPVGKIVTSRDGLLKEIAGSSFVVTVGDIVTLDLLESGVYPDICIVDFMTKRESSEELRKRFLPFDQPEIRVVNPQGTITQELWNAIEDGIRNPRKLRIVVEGEEDLASLACIALAPHNTTLIYGIPNRGASVHRVDDILRKMVNDTLDKMRA
ncbi:MAG: DUF359 domain-containing protein [Candidatus Thermoplasmatota archaeon]|nr:DUF359 domain-containing protein [Euryarchaeota archaeon]MBU4031312.1 DUF359 domain-containing protein [Candidatus Thermoplasmatota archaeon]MBU4070969.1 DUF359 domain-containing protein [Candidatus Thermoplasmatota archaeon]MBU4144862.1 DUF359 domain-containing protein [Candidatus Thermoplasmatota archaeon]MBU4592175.1 DUF359 domain-containing protein [Candidatus Thermoplasmatota archaeon]